MARPMSRILKDSWLDVFEAFTHDTEPPKEWLLWSGISVLSSTIKRNCFTWYREIKFYPNQYIILVGPPGIGKGEAISAGYNIANRAKTINYIKDWHTPQEIIETLAEGFTNTTLKIGQVITTNVIKDHTCTIIAPELAVFLQNYDNLHALMCTWWDRNEFDYKTKNKGKHIVEDMSVGLLGGCVPDYIRSLSRDRLAPITGGFTARVIFVYATEKYQLKDDFFGKPTVAHSKIEDDLVADLRHISTLQGELTFEKSAAELWHDVYREHNKRGDIDSDPSTNFKARISSHIVKTVITVSLSESDSLTITRNQLERAIKYVEAIRDKVDIVFRCIGESPLSVIGGKILTYIDMMGVVSYKQLLKFIWRDATEDQLGQVLKVFIATGNVKETTNSNGTVVYESVKTVTFRRNGHGNP